MYEHICHDYGCAACMYSWFTFVKGGGVLNASTAVTQLITYWFHFVVWLWGFADSIIVYQNITLLDVCIFSLVASLTVDVVLWVN